MNLFVPILALALTAGQLIRIPIGAQSANLLDITVSLFCLWGLLKLKFRLCRPPVQITAALIFIFMAIISLIFTPLRLQAGEYAVSFSYTIRFVFYVLFAWLVFSGAYNRHSRRSEESLVDTRLEQSLTITKAFLISGISFAVLGLLQFIILPNLDFLTSTGWDPHYFRTVSTFLDPNFAGAFLILTILILLSLRGGSLRPTWQSCLLFIPVYLALLTTFSRSGYLMFLFSGMTFAFFKKSIKYALVTLILFAILLFGFNIYTQLISKPRNIDRTQSASFRLSTWQQGIQLFQKSPILGIGFNAYRYGIRQYNLGDQQFLNSHGSSSNDSSLLFVLSTTGILGLGIYLYFLWTLLKPLNEKNVVIISALAGLLIHSVFTNSLFYPPILAWVLLISVTPKK